MSGPRARDGARSLLAVLIALLVGLAAGAFGVRWFSIAPADAPAVPASQILAPGDALEGASAPRTPELARSERTSADSAVAPSAPETDVLISDALRRYANAGITQGWSKVRQDEIPAEDLAEGMKSYEKLVLESPASLGRALGERRTKAEAALEDARTGGVFALLETLDGGGVGPLGALVRDPGQFEPLFQRASEERQRDALSKGAHPDELAEEGATLNWPAGVFRVENLMWEKHPYPRDVTLAGAGMDKTMLVIGDGVGNDSLITNGASLTNFAIRDCTVHTNRNYLFLMHTKPVSVSFDRVRFVGFDSGLGGSCLFAAGALALTARACRFEGGYGASPQHGSLLDVRSDALLARFEGCRLSLLALRIWGWHHGATALFLGCTLDQMLDDPEANATDKPGVVFDGCSITKHEGGWENVPKIDLNALFPDWKARME